MIRFYSFYQPRSSSRWVFTHLHIVIFNNVASTISLNVRGNLFSNQAIHEAILQTVVDGILGGGFFWRFGRSQLQKTEERWSGGQIFLLFCGRHKLMTPNTLTWSNFPQAIYIENAGIFADCLCGSINTMSKSSLFPNPLKLNDVTPLHKKTEDLKKKKT